MRSSPHTGFQRLVQRAVQSFFDVLPEETLADMPCSSPHRRPDRPLTCPGTFITADVLLPPRARVAHRGICRHRRLRRHEGAALSQRIAKAAAISRVWFSMWPPPASRRVRRGTILDAAIARSPRGAIPPDNDAPTSSEHDDAADDPRMSRRRRGRKRGATPSIGMARPLTATCRPGPDPLASLGRASTVGCDSEDGAVGVVADQQSAVVRDHDGSVGPHPLFIQQNPKPPRAPRVRSSAQRWRRGGHIRWRCTTTNMVPAPGLGRVVVVRVDSAEINARTVDGHQYLRPQLANLRPRVGVRPPTGRAT